ncbi:hypothetical protein HBI56_124000 [Parastagonospora nodorum]|uniref:Uncharacterized protein n=2 Tax=Phaeosphaeria nodorum (strain SN15 / ATCC MYA-4574 / FGSC 10173) TaxID=321614 RepID=A0A7U2F4U4_PHANO|nr:hypothetical protein SNOG_04539 [Parastagonospora nodorum SN15]KAH3908913.1 hypothetical protein HBH56_165300 [Parastagonospora nodorum]EAT88299.1 hypothetical protein SNOG_04539 [Parastagonospora nodorum SN15]KAH3936157.1 hypothetical protein HBH54_028390 [Parastagonospora nodorum]KAH3948268.1 hypothetical protein HBH53_103190 [Parastagonospora nodorum]KAH3968797.1 hypothetical protein HBH51_127070 [Parastagonospora nodorum]
MSRHDDSNPHDRQMEIEAVSSDRPPHLNESNCRYCCGLGCSGPQSGDDDGEGGCGSDATSTVVGSDNDVGDLEEPLHVEEVYEPQPFGPEDSRTSERQPGGFTYRSEEDLRFHRFLRAQRSIFISSILNRNRDELDSLRNEATTRSHSSASSEVGSADNMSQEGLVAGVGTWGDAIRHDRLPGLFRKTPLRLSAQYEDCRGPSLSHLITQDVTTLLSPNGRWGAQSFPNAYSTHYDGDSFAH